MPDDDPSREALFRLMGILWPGAMAAQAVHVAAELGLADQVASGPKTAAELAAATGADPAALERLLRAVVSLGLFAEGGDGRFAQSPMSDLLRSDHPQSFRPWARFQGVHYLMRPLADLESSVRSGRPSFDAIYGAGYFEYLDAHPADAAIFNAAMSSSPAYLDMIVQAVDFSRFRRIVDVGGGHGLLLAAILRANPGLRGVLLDLPAVVAGTSALRQPDLAGRSELVGGSFFDGVPAGADAYILKGVLHDWDDAAAGRILRNIRAAIAPGGALLVADAVLAPDSAPASAMMDLLMMVLCNGRERREADFAALFRAAGFELAAVHRRERITVVEGRPV